MFRLKKKWETNWRGHQIVVENWWDLLLRGGEELFIDGVRIQQEEGIAVPSRDLGGVIYFEGKIHLVRAHVGSTNYGTAVGCQIFVDEELIGGDIGKTFVT